MPRKPAAKKAAAKPAPASLFGDDEAPAPAGPALRVNPAFAARYEETKRKQELSRARDLGIPLGEDGDASSSSDEEEDGGTLLTAELDKNILKTLEAIRRKDPRIYDAKTTFFKDSEQDADGEPEPEAADSTKGGDKTARDAASKSSSKKLTAKDVMRQQLMEAAARGETDAFADDDDDFHRRRKQQDEGNRNVRVYDDEQATLRRAFLESAAADAADEADGLLTLRPKKAGADAKNKKAEEASDDDDNDEDVVAEVGRNELRQYLKSKTGRRLAEHADELADPEQFLTAFVRSKAWREESEDEGAAEVPHYEDIVTLDEDGEAVDKADEFEAQYNFRFEDPSGNAIVTHARRVADSLRRPDTKRKDERERREQRKREEREAMEAETRRLMNVKRAELKSRVFKIKDVAGEGVNADRLASLFADELDKDFDPATYDAKMAALFNDDYYAAAETDLAADGVDVSKLKNKKTAGARAAAAAAADESAGEGESEDEDEAVPGWVFGDGSRPSWAGPDVQQLAEGADGFETLFNESTGPRATDAEEGAPEEAEEEDDPAVTGGRRRQQRRKLKSKKMAALVERGLAMLSEDADHMHDPDEVLALGFEDVIAGGIKTRFKYRPVAKADFGLDANEILALDDTELNRYVGLKRIAPYRDAEWVVPKAQRKTVLKELRRKAAAALEAAAAAEAASAPKLNRKQRRAAALQRAGEGTGGDALAGTEDSAGADVDVAQVAPSMLAAPTTEEGGDDSAASETEQPAAGAGEAAAGGRRRRKKNRKHKASGSATTVGASGADAPMTPAHADAPAASGSATEAAAAPAEKEKKETKKKEHKDKSLDAAAATTSGHKVGDKRKRSSSKKAADAVVTLPSGAHMKKSRLDAYDL